MLPAAGVHELLSRHPECCPWAVELAAVQQQCPKPVLQLEWRFRYKRSIQSHLSYMTEPTIDKKNGLLQMRV